MIPISLRLQNFLSYGTDTEALDFTQFDVACLSGANGQGKSALLDAITWAMWGQARKSSHNRKPDAELLRIGTREMRVEFVFDIEGERYRVERLFAQSASGKTPKSGLEVAIYDGSDWRALTGVSQADTQVRLDEIIGVDYDTFVNASFLLQGRSDEFTRRKPEDRKEVLARILDLRKYEVLADRAADHERQAKADAERCEERITQLDAALAALPSLEAERDEATTALERLSAQRADLDTRLDTVVHEVMRLRAQQDQAVEIEQSLVHLDEVLAGLDAEITGLRTQVERAEAVLASRDTILADAERYESLRDEQARLHALAVRDRDLERRISEVRQDIERRESAHRQRVHALETEYRLLQDQISAMERDVRQRPTCQRQVEEATAAAIELRALNEQLARRDALRREADRLRLVIEREQMTLEAQVASLVKNLDEGRRNLPDADVLDREDARTRAELEALDALKPDQEAIQQQGTEIGEEITRIDARLQALAEAMEKVHGQQARLQDEEETECPTCGTRLTAEHRRRVMADLRQELAAFTREQRSLEETKRDREAARSVLRQRFAQNREQLKHEPVVREARTRVEEQQKVREQRLAELREWNEAHMRLRRTLEARDFRPDERRALADAERALADLAIDEAHLETVRERAAGLSSLRESLARLDQAEVVLGERRTRLSAVESERRACADAEAGGQLLGDLPLEAERLTQERAALSFDPERLSHVQADLHTLQDVPRRRAELDSARDHHDEWTKQLASRVAARTGQETARLRLVERRDALAPIAGQLRACEEQRVAVEAERKEVQRLIAEAQQRLGGIAERLRRADEDRATRERLLANLADARDRASLYRHLRTAFSKKGIPSLIIEQTLPEIEDRANALLERLSDGRLRVRLETIRDKKTGGTAETLDIFISDELGVTRAYETFSGGEAFRVNFALRIALSQLLAERSGIRIRTLVVDEGFGTQDAAGVQRLIEAINAVREDFDKILVVTHLDVLKDAFPTRIEVRKDPVSGSRYQVVTG